MEDKLTHFKKSEFNRNGRNWFDDMCPSLLVRLDVLRNIWNAPIIISPHKDAIGREDDSNSQHNINKWGEVKAIDVFFEAHTLNAYANAYDFFSIAKKVNFSGIGIYPDTTYNFKRRTMFHLDTGNRKATWSRINGVYRPFDEGLEFLSNI